MTPFIRRSLLIKLFVAAFIIGVYGHAGGYDAASDTRVLQASQNIDSAYREALILYQKGCYDLARSKINYVISILTTDSTTRLWRESKGSRPTRQDAQLLLNKINAKPAGGSCPQGAVSAADSAAESFDSERLQQIKEEARKEAQEREAAREALNRKLSIEREQAVADLKKEMEERQRKVKLEVEKARKESELKAREAQSDLEKKREERRLELLALQEKKQEETDRQRALMRKEEEQQRQERLLVEREEELLRQREERIAARRAQVERMEKESLSGSRKQNKTAVVKTQSAATGENTRDLIRERDTLIESADETAETDNAPSESDGEIAAAIKAHRDAEVARRVDALWRVSKKLFNQGQYEEAIKGFEAIAALEGSSRVKYAPEAKRLIEKARQLRLSAQDEEAKASLSTDVRHTEEKMIKEVYETQIPPYIDPPKKKVKQEVLPLIEMPLIRKKLQEKRVTMDFDKVGLKSVIKFLSQESGVNFVASQKVLGLDPMVTARFSDADLLEVIKYITKSLGLIYRIDKEIVWIADPEEVANEEMETRVYYLLKGGGLFTDFTPVSGGSTALGGSSAQINKIYTIEDTLKEVVPWPSDAKLTYDKRLNALIARNTPQNLQMLEEMLYSLDIEPVQVLIEARFIEIDITDSKDLGIELKLNNDFAFDKEGGEFAQGLASGGGVDFTSFTRASEGLNFTYKGVLTYPQFQAVLHALEETKRIKTLSSPRITTLNSQMASIKVVDEWIYPTRYEFEIVQYDLNGDGDYNDAGETAYQNVPKDFQRRDVGIILKVIPTVGADKKTINLSLIPEVSEATADAFQYSGNVTLPLFTSRNLSTTIVVNSADTVVLGGLVKESRTKTITKVPLLGSIPILGNLFKKDSDVVQRKNLMIFVTAKVLSPSGEEIIASGK